MKTDDLISLLSTGVARVDRKVALRRFARALPLGFAGSLVLMSIVFGVRHDLLTVAQTPIFWAKLAFPVCVALAAALAVSRVGRPGVRGGYAWALLVVPFVAVWAGGWITLGAAEPAQRAREQSGVLERLVRDRHVAARRHRRVARAAAAALVSAAARGRSGSRRLLEFAGALRCGGQLPRLAHRARMP